MKEILSKVSYHAVYDESIIDALAFAGSHGFAGIQWAVEAPHLAFESLPAEEIDRIAACRAEAGLDISLHAPDDACSLFSASRHLAEGIFRYFDAMMSLAGRIGAELITIHLGAPVTFGTDTDPPESIPNPDRALYRQVLARNLQRLIDLSAGRFVLCVENFRLEAMTQEVLQGFLDEGRLFLCWDLAKTFDAAGGPVERIESFYRRNIARVRQVHLHDIRDGRSHCVVGTGCIDFLHFLPSLAAADVMDYCIEVRPREQAVESLANLRRVLESV